MANQTGGRDVESAYGSDVASTLIMNREQFSIEDPISKTEMCYQWIKYRVCHYMILEALFFIILVLLLSNSYHISSQNEKTYELISSLHSRIENIEKQFGFDFGSKNVSLESSSEILVVKSKDGVDIKADKTEVNKIEMEQVQPVETSTTKEEQLERIPLVLPNHEKQPSTSNNNSLLEINAANIANGASIDTEYSSSPVSPEDGSYNQFFFKTEESNYVLLDRKELPLNKAWCSNAEKPILTVNLAKYIIPTAVSYQHTKWNGTVPIGAPRIYDLMACLDSNCKEVIPLVSYCEYKLSDEKQEQVCPIPPISNLSQINKVQFRFMENHGIVNKTCAYLVRVYGEPMDPPGYEEQLIKMEVEKKRKEENSRSNKCSDLAWRYQYTPVLYKGINDASCTSLYSNNCCIECPECCQECRMTPSSSEKFWFMIAGFAMVLLLTGSPYLLGMLIYGIVKGVCFLCKRCSK